MGPMGGPGGAKMDRVTEMADLLSHARRLARERRTWAGKRGYRARVMTELLDRLYANALGRWDELLLEVMDAEF